VLIDDEDPALQADPDRWSSTCWCPKGLGTRPTFDSGGGDLFPAPGVTQALRRTELIPPRPTGRCADTTPELEERSSPATAASVDNQDVERHFGDVVFLAGLVEAPIRDAR
jgi:hypothetical protein